VVSIDLSSIKIEVDFRTLLCDTDWLSQKLGQTLSSIKTCNLNTGCLYRDLSTKRPSKTRIANFEKYRTLDIAILRKGFSIKVADLQASRPC